MIADIHIHSIFSSDSITPVEEHVKRAIELKMDYVCITDHQDYDAPPLPPLNRIYLIADTDDTTSYMNEIYRVRELYKNKIKVLFGVELGLQQHLGEKLHDYVNSFPFDFVIGSSHYFNGLDGGDKRLYEGHSAEEVYQQYFTEELENITAFKEYDVVGHIDYVCRHAPGKLAAFEYRKYGDVLDEILKSVVNGHKGLECNTCPLMDGQTLFHPHVEVLKRYRELGGEILTFGSDAHTSNRVGGKFEQAADMVRSLGFKYYCVYEKHVPVFFGIVSVI